MSKGTIVKIGTVENGIASGWSFDCSAMDDVCALAIEVFDGVPTVLYAGYTADELQTIAESN